VIARLEFDVVDDEASVRHLGSGCGRLFRRTLLVAVDSEQPGRRRPERGLPVFRRRLQLTDHADSDIDAIGQAALNALHPPPGTKQGTGIIEWENQVPANGSSHQEQQWAFPF
jgi:hypothetical protein